MPNLLFPGRPDYAGPTEGFFGLLHHDTLCEPSRNVLERVAHVRENKSSSEIPVRLHNMIYLGGCEAAIESVAYQADYEAKHAALYADYAAKHAPLYADYEARRAPLYADYAAKHAPLYADYEAKHAPLYADYEAKHAALYADYEAKHALFDIKILAYIREHIPDCAWDAKRKELQFPGSH